MESALTGFRPYFQYPNGVKYIGYWKQNLHEGDFGIKIFTNDLFYTGQWHKGRRHGWGTLGKRCRNGYAKRIYIGQWKNDFKDGEGKQYSRDGVYFGYWSGGKRNGFGIMWYTDGRMFLGEWQNDGFHGTGVLFEKNGNRYEGNFENGLKNGEGKYFHNSTGQLQSGVWVDGICKASVMCDAFRNQVTNPTAFSIPPNYIADCYHKVQEFFNFYIKEKEKPPDYTGFCEALAVNSKKRMIR